MKEEVSEEETRERKEKGKRKRPLYVANGEASQDEPVEFVMDGESEF